MTPSEEDWKRLATAACEHRYRPLTIDRSGYAKWWKCERCKVIVHRNEVKRDLTPDG